jgi:hypothetical protein
MALSIICLTCEEVLSLYTMSTIILKSYHLKHAVEVSISHSNPFNLINERERNNASARHAPEDDLNY